MLIRAIFRFLSSGGLGDQTTHRDFPEMSWNRGRESVRRVLDIDKDVWSAGSPLIGVCRVSLLSNLAKPLF
ncbi:MAG: hypothetical protein L7W43_09675 [Rubripirellula sp.]|nr:hypothetical protein [Rubripirellula sp.]